MLVAARTAPMIAQMPREPEQLVTWRMAESRKLVAERVAPVIPREPGKLIVGRLQSEPGKLMVGRAAAVTALSAWARQAYASPRVLRVPEQLIAPSL